ncbi:MAG: TSUP family transporter, partial [Planctomycetes bacterium]|nr:TSUP family transporter [Planctomycetota bacterium]
MEFLEFISVGLAAFFAAGLTMFSGFGLGTLMLPVFALFFPVEMAVVATAMVHGANNLFKVTLLGRHADREVVLKFGLPAVLSAVVGAMALAGLAHSGSSISIQVNDTVVSEITPVKLIIGLLMI